MTFACTCSLNMWLAVNCSPISGISESLVMAQVSFSFYTEYCSRFAPTATNFHALCCLFVCVYLFSQFLCQWNNFSIGIFTFIVDCLSWLEAGEFADRSWRSFENYRFWICQKTKRQNMDLVRYTRVFGWVRSRIKNGKTRRIQRIVIDLIRIFQLQKSFSQKGIIKRWIGGR